MALKLTRSVNRRNVVHSTDNTGLMIQTHKKLEKSDFKISLSESLFLAMSFCMMLYSIVNGDGNSLLYMIYNGHSYKVSLY